MYRIGKKKAFAEVVKNMLDAKKFTVSEIANYANVTDDFVREIQKDIKKE
jgi:hypothetical protein